MEQIRFVKGWWEVWVKDKNKNKIFIQSPDQSVHVMFCEKKLAPKKYTTSISEMVNENSFLQTKIGKR